MHCGRISLSGRLVSPNALTPARFVDAFERADGVFSGFRRNHAKGVGVSGYFESNGQGARLSKAVVFRAGRVPVIGRFSFGGGDPNVADAPNMVRGLGLLFWLPDGEQWRTAMVNLPVFPFQTPQDFYDNLVASQPDPKTGKPDPEKNGGICREPSRNRAGVRYYPEPRTVVWLRQHTFNSLNAFRFIDAAGTSIPVRWSLAPVQPFVAVTTAARPRQTRTTCLTR